VTGSCTLRLLGPGSCIYESANHILSTICAIIRIVLKLNIDM